MSAAGPLTPLTPPLVALRVAVDERECSRSLDSERSSSIVSVTAMGLAVPRRVSDGLSAAAPSSSMHRAHPSSGASPVHTSASDGDASIQAPEIEVEHPSVLDGEEPPSMSGVAPPSSWREEDRVASSTEPRSADGAHHGMRITVTQPAPSSAIALAAVGSASFSAHDDDDTSPRSDVGGSPMEQQHQMSSFVFPTSGATSVVEIPCLQVEGEAQSQLLAAGGLVLGAAATAGSSASSGGLNAGGAPQRFRRLSSSTDTHPNTTTTATGPGTAYSVSPTARTYLSPRHGAHPDIGTLTRNSSLTTKRSSFSHSDGILTPLAGSQAPPLRTASFLNLMMVPIPTDIGEESLLDLLRLPVSPRGSLHSSAEDGCESDMSTVSSLPRKYSGNVTMAPTSSGVGGSVRPQVPSPVGADVHPFAAPPVSARGGGGNASLSPPSPFPRGGRQRGSDSQHTNSGSFSVSSVSSSVKTDALHASPHATSVPAGRGVVTRDEHGRVGDEGTMENGPSDAAADDDDDGMDRMVELLTGFFLEEIASRMAHLSIALDAMAPLRVHHADMVWRHNTTASMSAAASPTVGGGTCAIVSPLAAPGSRNTPPSSPTPVTGAIDAVDTTGPFSPTSPRQQQAALSSPRSAAALLHHAMDLAFDSAQEWFTTSMALYDTVMLIPLLRLPTSFPSQHVAAAAAGQESGLVATKPLSSPTQPSLQALFPFDDASWISLIGTIRVGTLVLSTRNFYYGLHVTLLSAFRIQPSGSSMSSSSFAQGSSTVHSLQHQQSLRSSGGSRRVGSPTTVVPSSSSPALPSSGPAGAGVAAPSTATSSPQNPSGSFHHHSSSSTGTSTSTSPTTTTLPTTTVWQQSVPSLWMSSMTNVFLRTMPTQWLPDIPMAASVSVSFRQASYALQPPPPGGSPSSLRAWSIPRGSFSTRRESDGAVSSLLWHQQSSPPHLVGGGLAQGGGVVAHYSARGNSLRLSHDDTAAAGAAGELQRRRSSSRRSSNSSNMRLSLDHRSTTTVRQQQADDVGVPFLMAQLLLFETSTRMQLEDLFTNLSNDVFGLYREMHIAPPPLASPTSGHTRLREQEVGAASAASSTLPRGGGGNIMTMYAPPRQNASLVPAPPPSLLNPSTVPMMQFEDLRIGGDEEEAEASTGDADEIGSRARIEGSKTAPAAGRHSSGDASTVSGSAGGSMSLSTQQILDLVDRRLSELGGWAHVVVRPPPSGSASDRHLSHHTSDPSLAVTLPTSSTLCSSFIGDASSSLLQRYGNASTNSDAVPPAVAGNDAPTEGRPAPPSSTEVVYAPHSARLPSQQHQQQRHRIISITPPPRPAVGSSSADHTAAIGGDVENTMPLTPHPPAPATKQLQKERYPHHYQAQQQQQQTTAFPVPPPFFGGQDANASPANCRDSASTTPGQQRLLLGFGEEAIETDEGQTHVVRTVRPAYEQRLRREIFPSGTDERGCNSHDFVAAIFRLRRHLLADVVNAEREARRSAVEAESAGRHVLLAAQHSPGRLADARVYFLCVGLPWSAEGATEESLARDTIAGAESTQRQQLLGGCFERLALCVLEEQCRTTLMASAAARWAHLRGMYEALFDGFLLVRPTANTGVGGSNDASTMSASSPTANIETTPPSPMPSNASTRCADDPAASLACAASTSSLQLEASGEGDDVEDGPCEQRPDARAAPEIDDGAASDDATAAAQQVEGIVQQAEYCAAVILAEASHAVGQLKMWMQRDFVVAARREASRRNRQARAAALVNLIETYEPAGRTAVSDACWKGWSSATATFRRIAYAMAPPTTQRSDNLPPAAAGVAASPVAASLEYEEAAAPAPSVPAAVYNGAVDGERQDRGNNNDTATSTCLLRSINEVEHEESDARRILCGLQEVSLMALYGVATQSALLHREVEATHAAVSREEQQVRDLMQQPASPPLSMLCPSPALHTAPAAPPPTDTSDTTTAAGAGPAPPESIAEHNLLSSDDDRDDSHRNSPSTAHAHAPPQSFPFDRCNSDGTAQRRPSAGPRTPHIAEEAGPLLANFSGQHDDFTELLDMGAAGSGRGGASLHAASHEVGGSAFHETGDSESDENEMHWWDHQKSQLIVQRSAPLPEDTNLTRGHRLPFDDVWFLFVVEVQKVKTTCIDALTRTLSRGATPQQQFRRDDHHSQQPQLQQWPPQQHHQPHRVTTTFHATVEQGPASVLRSILPQLRTSWVDSCTAVLGVPDATSSWTGLMLSTVMTRSPFALSPQHQLGHGNAPYESGRPAVSPSSTTLPSGRSSIPSPTRIASLLGCGSEDAYLGEWVGACHRHGNGLYEYAATALSASSVAADTMPFDSSAVQPALVVAADSEHPVPVVKDIYVGRWQHGLRHGSGFYVRVTRRSTAAGSDDRGATPSREDATPPQQRQAQQQQFAKASAFRTTVVFGEWANDELVKLRWYGSKDSSYPCECV